MMHTVMSSTQKLVVKRGLNFFLTDELGVINCQKSNIATRDNVIKTPPTKLVIFGGFRASRLKIPSPNASLSRELSSCIASSLPVPGYPLRLN